MADVEVQHTPAPAHAEGIKGFLKTDTAGMPNWVWLLVIAGGIGLALVVKHMTAAKSGNTAPTTGAIPDSGLGLAIDPTTGLPYAVEGLVPSGNAQAGQQGYTPPPVPTPTPTPGTCAPGFTFQSGALGAAIPIGSYPVAGGYCKPNDVPDPTPTPKPPPTPQPQQKFVTVQKWPAALSTLWGISQQYGLTLQRIEQLNPQITNPNLIYAGQQVRVA